MKKQITSVYLNNRKKREIDLSNRVSLNFLAWVTFSNNNFKFIIRWYYIYMFYLMFNIIVKQLIKNTSRNSAGCNGLSAEPSYIENLGQQIRK